MTRRVPQFLVNWRIGRQTATGTRTRSEIADMVERSHKLGRPIDYLFAYCAETGDQIELHGSERRAA